VLGLEAEGGVRGEVVLAFWLVCERYGRAELGWSWALGLKEGAIL
jgi:hypothetical protein